MKTNAKPNPFHMLGLPTHATDEEVVSRSNDLCQVAQDADVPAIKEARRVLLEHPVTRQLHELLEIPATRYRDDEWQVFAKSHRKIPVDLDALAGADRPITVADFDLSALLSLLLDGMLSAPEADVLSLLLCAPFPLGAGRPPLEVRHVLFG